MTMPGWQVRRAWGMGIKVLRGNKPANIPVDHPTIFDSS
jgi:hypothetical protein